MADLIVYLEAEAAMAHDDESSGGPEPVPMNVVANEPGTHSATNNVQLLNEAAQRASFSVIYIAESAGEPHAPEWTVHVRGGSLLDKQERSQLTPNV